MHKNATKCNKTLSKWCKNKHGASKIIDTFETYQGPGAELALPRCAGAPDRILPRRDWYGNVGSFIGLAPALTRFQGRRCGLFFGPKPKFHVGRVLGPPVEML
jgi:hypothetical protein